MGDHICLYCERWCQNPIVYKGKKNEGIVKQCSATKKKISSNDSSCRFFIPVTNVYCDKNDERIPMVLCLNRRVNRDKYRSWSNCAKCRQFDKEILPILEKYHVGLAKINREARKLKRRKNKKEGERILKRRTPKNSSPKKLTKRRKKSEPRKLKRRNDKPKKLKKRRK